MADDDDRLGLFVLDRAREAYRNRQADLKLIADLEQRLAALERHMQSVDAYLVKFAGSVERRLRSPLS